MKRVGKRIEYYGTRVGMQLLRIQHISLGHQLRHIHQEGQTYHYQDKSKHASCQ